MVSSKSIKKKAIELGFQKVGIAKAEPENKKMNARSFKIIFPPFFYNESLTYNYLVYPCL